MAREVLKVIALSVPNYPVCGPMVGMVVSSGDWWARANTYFAPEGWTRCTSLDTASGASFYEVPPPKFAPAPQEEP